MKHIVSLFAVFSMAALFVAPASAEEERHPEIKRAIHALEVAREHLKHASHDFGGHREKALEACDRAIEQLHAAIDFDR